MRRICIYLILFAIFILGLGFRSNYLFSRKYISGEKVRIKGCLPEQPYHNISSQSFSISGIKIVTDRFPAYNYGECLVIEGILREDRYSSLSKAGNRFLRVLIGDQTDLVLIYPQISRVFDLDSRGRENVVNGFEFKSYLINLRQNLLKTYQQILPRPHSSLLAGIVLGQKMTMDEGFYAKLRDTGTLHIIVASGMNVSIVAGVLMSILLMFMKRQRAVLGVVGGIAAYVVISGASAPVIRAGIMGGLTFVAMMLGREKDGFRVLWFTAACMLLWNPRYLIDIGFELSFMATGGIMVGAKVIEGYILNIFNPGVCRRRNTTPGFLNWIAEALGVTLSAQIATAPLIYLYFGKLSWISPVVNVLLSPVVSVITIWGMVVGVAGLLWLDLARILGWGAWVFLEYFVLVVKVGAWFT